MSLQSMAQAGLIFGSIATALTSLPARTASRHAASVVEVRVTAADGRRLVEEALAQGENKLVVLTLQPGASAFQVEGARVVLLATAQSGPLTCPVRISGVPAIQANQLALASPDISTSGMLCNSALDLLRQKSLEALTAHPWDLATRLAIASLDPSKPGPRLPIPGCVLPEQLNLKSVRAQSSFLAVTVEVLPPDPGTGCR
jgi:hypothetical protein